MLGSETTNGMIPFKPGDHLKRLSWSHSSSASVDTIPLKHETNTLHDRVTRQGRKMKAGSSGFAGSWARPVSKKGEPL
jgi:hypothetical protein